MKGMTLGEILPKCEHGDYIRCVHSIQPTALTEGKRYMVQVCCYKSKSIMTDERLPWYDSIHSLFVLDRKAYATSG